MNTLKRLIMVGIVSLVITLGIASVSHAESTEGTLSDSHLARIRANCTVAKGTLERLHRSDALLRVNRGQLYESISTKLMARFNSRVALNRLDGTELVSTAASYERSLDSFRSAYQAYEIELAAVLKIDCTKDPQAFYERIEAAHAKRQEVHESVQRLYRYIDEYGSAIQSFARQYTIAVRGATL